MCSAPAVRNLGRVPPPAQRRRRLGYMNGSVDHVLFSSVPKHPTERHH